jgi:integrase
MTGRCIRSVTLAELHLGWLRDRGGEPHDAARLNKPFVELGDRRDEGIPLPQTKNGEGRIVYLNTLALQVFDAQLRRDLNSTERIFAHLTGEQVSMAFRRVAKAAKIEDFRFHDLRHTAASWLRMQGADIHTVAQLLGHKDLRMAARYQHLSPAFLADAVKKLDQVFLERPAIVAA